MRERRRCGAACFCITVFTATLAAPSRQARADQYHYVNTLIGERAGTMGGAYTAISDDPSGVYYNPAGIVFGFENYLSVSANSYSRTETKFKNTVAGRDYSMRSSGFVPSFLGFSQSFGKSKIAFAIIVPDSMLLNQDDVLSELSTSAGSLSSLMRRLFQQDTTYLFGPSFSTAIGQKASFGVSLLGSIRVGTILDNQFLQWNPAAGGAAGTGKYFSQENQINYTLYGLTPKVGAQFMPTPKLVLGATVAKSINLSGKGSSRVIRGKVDGTGMPVTPTGSFNNDYEIIEREISMVPARPWVISGGMGYFPSKSLLFAADYHYYSADDGSTDFRAVSTYNVALGAEWFARESLALRLGAFTDNANTPALSSKSANQSPHVDLLGLSAGITLVRSGSSFTLGAQYARGSGKGQVIGDTTEMQTLEQSQLSVHIAGSYQL